MAQSISSVISKDDVRFLDALVERVTISRKDSAVLLGCAVDDVDARVLRLSALLGVKIAILPEGTVH